MAPLTAKLHPVVFGEVLFDCFPDGSRVLGGAPFNVAWHLQAFGLEPLLLSAVGRDTEGSSLLEQMKRWGMQTSGIRIHEDFPTGLVQVTIEAGEPVYDIRPDCAWDAVGYQELAALPDNFLLYHGSLALRSGPNRETLARLKQQAPAACFLDINLRPPWWNEEIAGASLSGITTLKLNAAELKELATGAAADVSPAASVTVEESIARVMERYAPERLIVTRGAQGVLALERSSGMEPLSLPAGTADRVVDTVGAGDAFSSVCIAGQCLGWSLEQTLSRAMTFASAIVGIRGATPQQRDFYQPFLEQW